MATYGINLNNELLEKVKTLQNESGLTGSDFMTRLILAYQKDVNLEEDPQLIQLASEFKTALSVLDSKYTALSSLYVESKKKSHLETTQKLEELQKTIVANQQELQLLNAQKQDLLSELENKNKTIQELLEQIAQYKQNEDLIARMDKLERQLKAKTKD